MEWLPKIAREMKRRLAGRLRKRDSLRMRPENRRRTALRRYRLIRCSAWQAVPTISSRVNVAASVMVVMYFAEGR